MVLDDKYLELVKEALALQCNGEYDKALDKYKEAFEITATVHDISGR